MTPTQAYAADPTFRALVDAWVRDRRCPPPLVDRCLDLGLEAAADCARWASDPVATPDLPVFSPHANEDPTPCGPYPTFNGVHWYWVACFDDEDIIRPHWIPRARVPRHDNTEDTKDPTPAAAILYLLESWRP